MKTLIYVIRHGQSTGNLNHIFLGHTDGALTALGRKQALCAGAYLKEMNIHFDKVYASSLRRAYETAVLASGVESPILRDDLREIFAGVWEGMPYEEIALKHREDYERWFTDLGNAAPTGGEPVRDLSSRVVSAVLSIAAENEGKTVLLGTHATPVRLLEAYARGLSLNEANEVPWAANASLSAYLCEGKTLTPLFYGLDAYIGDLSTTVAKNI